jgi:hypothetical protein
VKQASLTDALSSDPPSVHSTLPCLRPLWSERRCAALRCKRRALAARDAHAALRDLKRLIDDATRTTHAAELEAIGLAISSVQWRFVRPCERWSSICGRRKLRLVLSRVWEG